jgi:hypothetical protein
VNSSGTTRRSSVSAGYHAMTNRNKRNSSTLIWFRIAPEL